MDRVWGERPEYLGPRRTPTSIHRGRHPARAIDAAPRREAQAPHRARELSPHEAVRRRHRAVTWRTDHSRATASSPSAS
jgi:hypothetical protein